LRGKREPKEKNYLGKREEVRKKAFFVWKMGEGRTGRTADAAKCWIASQLDKLKGPETASVPKNASPRRRKSPKKRIRGGVGAQSGVLLMLKS